jgi:predicted RNA-binding protein YlxR (DUF448 family)
MQDRLFRMVADAAGRIRIDDLSRQPGRGAYVHGERACVENMVKRAALPKALRRNLVPVTSGDIWERIGQVAERRRQRAQ